ncbi:2-amino-4-hydroxy-6-hydroxymethyldihydropteridine diphosphokinase [Longibacter salinarum]|uniref:2-amino-4-hydroxy-6-hydroxymethyldihydropteridine pyrophosphokinase n=2 Tax=Longibacter salinarum TaxID=1850348 RepID=A0A2A8CYR5_9BACT|nr:2-amino-4-hydroxy-6-hydroxymethyldihydropteridine diphosphokinase [Longibacter salinarum]
MDDRMGHLRLAVNGLEAAGATIRGASPVYRSEALTLDPEEVQPDYLNAVLEIRTDRSPHDLLALAKRIEQDAGRDLSARRWSPRPLDIDLLVAGRAQISDDDLVVPHPRLAERRFVLQPWSDLAPNLVVPPPFDDTVSALLDRCPDAGSLTLDVRTWLPEFSA